jgi:hypothetical protein
MSRLLSMPNDLWMHRKRHGCFWADSRWSVDIIPVRYECFDFKMPKEYKWLVNRLFSCEIFKIPNYFIYNRSITFFCRRRRRHCDRSFRPFVGYLILLLALDLYISHVPFVLSENVLAAKRCFHTFFCVHFIFMKLRL